MASSTSKLRDPNTLSNYDKFRTRHIAANLNIDFQKKQLQGSVLLDLEVLDPGNEIVLDSSYVDVKDVTVDLEDAKWQLSPRSEPYGSALKIQLDKNIETGNHIKLRIQLTTTDECTALQWLTPEQTSNKKHPYMFSQCQAIHARSIFPCQDTPDVKATVDFHITSPLPVIASGNPIGVEQVPEGAIAGVGDKLYTFEQKVPIPSYLFALASGDIDSTSVGPRSKVATGPEELAAAKWELEADMERYIDTAENILQKSPYAWGTYNVLVLPASFPYGGMENPVYTFATPSIISGDRENIDVIAHELAHSWSGNLVSNASWEHFWLNEGWTVYLERRIIGAIHGEAARSFSAIIGWKALTDSITHYGETHDFTKLIVDLKDKDPDDAFSSVPYEKGSTFLLHLETLLGRPKFDTFIPHYFSTFAQKSLDSYQFKECLLSFFASDADASQKLQSLDWNAWFFASGFPPKPAFDTSLADAVYALADKWKTRAEGDTTFTPTAADVQGLSSHQLVVLLERVELFSPPLSSADARQLGAVYGLVQSKNMEIVARYLRVALRAGDESAKEPAAEFLGRVGRMKFVRPLYKQLNRVDEGFARATFERLSGFYHPICWQMVRQDLGLGAEK